MVLPAREELLKGARRRQFRSVRILILVSILIITITAFLVVYYDFFKKHESMGFLIAFLWPSGVVIVLYNLLSKARKDYRAGVGRALYFYIQELVKAVPASDSDRKRLLGYLLDKREGLMSRNPSVREEALDKFIEMASRLS